MSLRGWVRCGCVLGLLVGSATAGCSGSDEEEEHTLGSGGAASGGSGGSQILGPAGGATTGGASGTGGGVTAGDTSACGICATAEGCVVVHVTRSDDTTAQPWVVWPDEADGIGTLVVSVGAGDIVRMARVTGADLKPPTAAYDATLCAPSGQVRLNAFLDEDEDADQSAVFSGDYLDSCAVDRQIDVSVPAAGTLTVPYVLNNSCD